MDAGTWLRVSAMLGEAWSSKTEISMESPRIRGQARGFASKWWALARHLSHYRRLERLRTAVSAWRNSGPITGKNTHVAVKGESCKFRIRQHLRHHYGVCSMHHKIVREITPKWAKPKQTVAFWHPRTDVTAKSSLRLQKRLILACSKGVTGQFSKKETNRAIFQWTTDYAIAYSRNHFIVRYKRNLDLLHIFIRKEMRLQASVPGPSQAKGGQPAQKRTRFYFSTIILSPVCRLAAQ